MNYLCKTCQRYLPAVLDIKPFAPGDKVTFSRASLRGRGRIHISTCNGVVLEISGNSAVVKVRGKPEPVSLSRLQHKDMPSSLGISFTGLCECNISQSCKEHDNDK
ncbi:MAG: hypothetical protein ACRC8L_06165 [Plesiomonas shigelloides]